MATVSIPAGNGEEWRDVTVGLDTSITGVHDVFFKYAGAGDTNLFDIDYWQFAEGSGVEPGLSAKIEDGKIVAVYKNGGDNVAGRMIIGIYNVDGVLVTNQIVPFALAAGEAATAECAIDGLDGSGFTYRVFVWNSAFTPICPSIEGALP